MADYIIVGGGLAGCVVASRLKEYNPLSAIVLIEAGTDEHANPLTNEPMAAFQLYMSPLEYNGKTSPQKNYDGRQVYTSGGKMLSGSSACNFGTWTRGNADDYNVWADLVQDDRWSWAGQLPYFKKNEHHFDPKGDKDIHGFDGPIHTTPAKFDYPLKDDMRSAYERVGLKANQDVNSGHLAGYSTYVENWKTGRRQFAGTAYSLSGVEVMVATAVKRILFATESSKLVAKGVELTSGRQIMASKEVILSCGTYLTPQLLMLSGIGPTQELNKHNIGVVLDAPGVGQNVFDHVCVSQFYKVRKPEAGICAGTPSFHMRIPPEVSGMPVNYIGYESADLEGVKRALQDDGVAENHPLVTQSRSNIETLVVYAPTEAPLTGLNIPFNGTIVTINSLNMLPTSRGSITLSSPDVLSDPVINPNFFSTNVDKFVTRTAMRRAMAMMETPEMSAVIEGEVSPEGYPALNSRSTDAELDERVKRVGCGWYHPAGSCAMGKVVDTDLKVKGVQNLRVVDASVFPTPIAAHLQCPTYALAEQAAAIISEA